MVGGRQWLAFRTVVRRSNHYLDGTNYWFTSTRVYMFHGFSCLCRKSLNSGASNGTGDEALLGVSAGFQVVMKQLGKRDTTTKLKVGLPGFE